MRRALSNSLLLSSLLLAVGCAKGTSTLTLTVGAKGTLAGVDHFDLTVTDETRMRTAPKVTVKPSGAPVSLPPAQTMQLVFDSSVSGRLHVAIDAIGSNGQTLGSTSGDVAIKPSATARLAVDFAGDGAPPDLGTGGDGGVGGLVADESSIDFGSVNVGSSSGLASLIVSNQGHVPSGKLTTTLDGADAAAFVIDADSCKGSSLQPQSSCTVTLHFPAMTTGAVAGLLTISGDAGSVSATLAGTGVAVGSFAIAPTSKTFPGTPVGSSTADVSFTISYGATVMSGTPTVGISGSGANSFVISNNGCTAPLTMTTTCAVSVHFAPSAPGTVNASLTVTGTPGGTNAAALSGTGLAPAQLVAVTASPQAFGSVVQNGSSSATLTLTFANSGGVASGLVSVASSAASEFVVESDDCGGNPLAAGAQCSAMVHFTPAAAGSRSATLTASAGGSGGMATITMTGNGLAPAALQMSPASNNYNTIDVGMSSTAVTYTLSNPGNVASGAIASMITGSTADFVVTDNCNGKALAGNGSCTYVVTFTPATYGSKSLSIQASATPGGTVVASLSGTGRDMVVLTVTISDQGGGGPITSSPPGINCQDFPPMPPGTCAFSFYRGTAVTLSAPNEVNNAGTEFFGGWAGCNSTATNGDEFCYVTMDANKTVGASWQQD